MTLCNTSKQACFDLHCAYCLGYVVRGFTGTCWKCYEVKIFPDILCILYSRGTHIRVCYACIGNTFNV